MNKQKSLPDLIVNAIQSFFGRDSVWQLLHQLIPFINYPRLNLDWAESLAQQLINIPSTPSLVGNVL